MMVKSRNDILERTMANYKFIKQTEASSPPDGPAKIYEATQLVNSFLMTLLQNWDELEQNWPHFPQAGLRWPSIKTSGSNHQARQCIGKIRDALAHGLFVFEGDQMGKIAAMHLWTCPDGKTVDWHAVISIGEMEQMLKCFVELAGARNLPLPRAKRKGMLCH